MLRLGDIAQVRRGYADPPQPMFRVNGEPAIGLAIAMRDGGDILALGRKHQDARWRRSRPTCRSASSRPGGRSAGRWTRRSPSSWTLAWQAIASSWRELPQPRRPRRHRRRALDPADAGHGVPVMELDRHRPAAHLAGGADHRAGLLVDDAMTTVDAMTDAAGGRATTRTAPRPSPTDPGLPDADRHAGDDGRLRADRLRAARPANTPSRSSPSSAWR